MLDYLKLIYYYLRPKTFIIRRISGAMGDCLLLSLALTGLRKRYPDYKIIIECKWPDLFLNNPHADWITRRHIKTTKRHIKPKYRILPDTAIPICKQVSRYVSEEEVFSPEIYLTEKEISSAREKFPFPYISICPVGKQRFSANRKEWGISNFQKVIDYFIGCQFVQIGTPEDLLLKKAIDARGLPIRQSAAVLKNSLFFIGLEGGLMHLSKAVDVKAVIIYGGFIQPELSKYEENLNIVNLVDCSPCFSSEQKHIFCNSMKCMKAISPDFVNAEIEKTFAKELESLRNG